MKDSRKFRLASIAVAGLSLWAVGLTDALAWNPKTGSATVTRTGPAGHSSTRQTTATTNGQGGFSAHSTFTGPAGNVSTRSQSGAYNAATHSYNRSGGATLANGQQTHFTSSTQATGNDGYVHSSTHTGPNGNSVTTQGQGSYNPATGQFDQTRTTTGPNGQSSTETRTVQVRPQP